MATEESLEKAEARSASSESYVPKITCLFGGTYVICFVASLPSPPIDNCDCLEDKSEDY